MEVAALHGESFKMHTGNTIENLIATVARVDARVQRMQSMHGAQSASKREVLRFPAMPFRETTMMMYSLARVGVL